MHKHVVFMVHGVGEQIPGETVDEFVGAACEELDLNGPVTNNTLMLANAEATSDGILNLFPCHQRRMPGPDQHEELVFSEVHWADISPAPKGVIGTALDLLRLVLGMGYIALDNVQNNVVGDNAHVQRLVPLFVWLFYAVIAPLNLFLLIGAFALLIDPFVLSFNDNPLVAQVLLGLFGLLFAIIGFGRTRTAKTYMDEKIMSALGFFGVLTVLFAVLFATNINFNVLHFMSPFCAELSQADTIQKLSCFTGIGVFGLKASWLIAVTLLILLVIVSLPGIRRHAWEKRSIYLAICSAMLIMWMTITVAIWSLAIEAMERIPGAQDMPAKMIIDQGFKEATQTLVYGVISLLVIIAVAVFVAIRRNMLRAKLSEFDTRSDEIDKKYGRVILNPWLNIALFVGIAAFAFSAYTAFAEHSVKASGITPSPDFVWAKIYHWAIETDLRIKGWATVAFFVISLIAFGILNYSSTIAAVVGVARDVTSYLTRARAGNPMKANSESSYVFADEIQARFRAVVEHVILQEGKDSIARITFMTHSQGTVVAAVGLKAQAQELPVKPTLITMGSPVTHIYGHYFEKNYQFTEASNGALAQWLNIYRRDDFVGTRVHGNGTDAENFKIRPKGHSHYWSDKRVWEIFKARDVF